MISELRAAPAENGASARETGIDLLRIVCMYGIVVLHTLGKGGVLYGTTPFSAGFLGVWFLEGGAMCAVNCYGLISGYCGVESRFSYRKYLPRWFQVAFYSVGIAALYGALTGGWVDWSAVLFPVSRGQYWYFSAYTVVFFLTPYLNKLLKSLDEREARRLCVTIFILFSVVSALFRDDPFRLELGYSALWLIALYLIGGCLRRFGVKRLLPAWGCFGAYVLLTLVGWGGMLLYQWNSLSRTGALSKTIEPFLQYTSPFVLLASVALFLCFRQMKVKSSALRKVIVLLAPVSFGVYLIHNNDYVAWHLMTGCMARFLTLPAPAYLSIGLALAVGIYLVCSLLDGVRLLLFHAVERVLPKRKEK